MLLVRLRVAVSLLHFDQARLLQFPPPLLQIPLMRVPLIKKTSKNLDSEVVWVNGDPPSLFGWGEGGTLINLCSSFLVLHLAVTSRQNEPGYLKNHRQEAF